MTYRAESGSISREPASQLYTRRTTPWLVRTGVRNDHKAFSVHLVMGYSRGADETEDLDQDMLSAAKLCAISFNRAINSCSEGYSRSALNEMWGRCDDATGTSEDQGDKLERIYASDC